MKRKGKEYAAEDLHNYFKSGSISESLWEDGDSLHSSHQNREELFLQMLGMFMDFYSFACDEVFCCH